MQWVLHQQRALMAAADLFGQTIFQLQMGPMVSVVLRVVHQ
jgi:hypothetical protein